MPHSLLIPLLIVVVVIVLGTSFLCSLLEGFILSITQPEIDLIKIAKPRAGARLERHKNEITQTVAAILALNTVANVCGASFIGFLSGKLFGSTGVMVVTAALTLIVLVFCEILPKSVGVLFRKRLGGFLMRALDGVIFVMYPIAWLCKMMMRVILPRQK